MIQQVMKTNHMIDTSSNISDGLQCAGLTIDNKQESFKSVKSVCDFDKDRTVEQRQPWKTNAEILRSVSENSED